MAQVMERHGVVPRAGSICLNEHTDGIEVAGHSSGVTSRVIVSPAEARCLAGWLRRLATKAEKERKL